MKPLFKSLVLMTFALSLTTPIYPSVSAEDNQATEQSGTNQQILKAPFDEVLPEDSPYPVATIEHDIDIQELRDIMTDYFKNTYTQEEQEVNYQSIDSSTLQQVQAVLDEEFPDLQAHVEEVQIEIAGKKTYVLRVIIPMTYQEAEKKATENNIHLLNTIFNEIPNRLVMLAYYDPSQDTVTPLTLTNYLNPIFYNEQLTQVNH
ncbi:hypothetical protein [Hutsoniella sourekii]|uniref:hypothetical protein n=1 Tax=Hutsoniella sourekii TaxID=87650 RepID=UPI0004833988|nr:hypothetical protein [Hutsoniella sourekii]